MRENFQPAFDMPTTPEEALAVLTAWGNETTKTFRHDKARACAALLQPVWKPAHPGDVLGRCFDCMWAGKSRCPHTAEQQAEQGLAYAIAVAAAADRIRNAKSGQEPSHCQCEACRDGTIHASDCAVHNEPAYPKGPCNCDAGTVSDAVALAFHNAISDSPINADEMAELKVGLKAALVIARQEQTRKRANVAEPSEYAKAFEAGRKSVLMWIDPSIKAEIDAAQQQAIHEAAKAVERSATVWEGFSYQDAKLCIDTYLRAAQAGK